MTEYPLCRHVRTNGLQCQSPALTGEDHCYFHNRLHARHARFRPTPGSEVYFTHGQDLDLGPLEDRESVQSALSVVINALATGRIDARRGTTLLYGLQLASSNAARLNPTPGTPNVVRAVESSPTGLDLAEPGAVIEIYNSLELHEIPALTALPEEVAIRPLTDGEEELQEA
jgi:hypothetical protein